MCPIITFQLGIHSALLFGFVCFCFLILTTFIELKRALITNANEKKHTMMQKVFVQNCGVFSSRFVSVLCNKKKSGNKQN